MHVTIWPTAKIVTDINFGNNIMIDDFTFIGPHKSFSIGNYVHISSHCSFIGGGDVILEDFSGIGTGNRIISGTEEHEGKGLIGPVVPPEFRFAKRSFVVIKKHVCTTSNVVILPGVTIGEGCFIGANSMVNKDLSPWTICYGTPAREMGKRNKENILKFEAIIREREGW